MDSGDIAALIASLLSIFIGLLAIWLALTFFKMSSQAAKDSKESADRIGASVERLEDLFNKLYTDTFTMFKETVLDMRRHVWPETVKSKSPMDKEVERLASERIQALQQEVGQSMAHILKEVKIKDDMLKQTQAELQKQVYRAINESKKVQSEATEEALRERIIRLIKQWDVKVQPLIAEDIAGDLVHYVPLHKIVAELKAMKNEGLIDWDGVPLRSHTLIKMGKRLS
jgi:hypothetical protein